MKVNDRGTKKWTSIMMPEHIDALKKLFAEQDYKERPILDEQQMMENEMMLQEAIQKDLMIEVKYFKDHDYHAMKGVITSVTSETLMIGDNKIKLEDVIEVNLY